MEEGAETNSKIQFTFVLAFLMMTLLTHVVMRVSATAPTTVQVNPNYSVSSVGQSFTVNITITNVINLNAWQLYLLFNPAMLNCNQILVPTDNIFGSNFGFYYQKIDNTGGSVLAFCSMNASFAVNGSGTLCQIHFSGLSPGISCLDIANEMQSPVGTYLQDPNYSFINFQSSDGAAEVDGPNFQRSVFSATQGSKTYPVVILSNSTVDSFTYDQSLKIMTFNASGQSNTAGLSSIMFSKELFNGTLAVLVDNRAIYCAVSGNETHNFLLFNYTQSTRKIQILPTIKGDVNGDRAIDMKDIVQVILAYGSLQGLPNWNPLADVTGPSGVPDGKVDMKDVVFEIINFGSRWRP